MEFKGTTEKWKTTKNLVFSDDYFQTHVAIIPDSYNEEIRIANALLISKSPEMLEMLKELVKQNELRGYSESEDVLKAKQLIKEATELK